MNEAARHLDQPLVKLACGLATDREPDFLEHVVRLIIKLRVEAAEEPNVMAIKPGVPQICQQRVDLGRLVGHRSRRDGRLLDDVALAQEDIELVRAEVGKNLVVPAHGRRLGLAGKPLHFVESDLVGGRRPCHKRCRVP